MALAAPGAARAQEPAASSDAARAAYASAAALQNRQAWDLAADEWAALVAKHPDDPLALKGRYYLGICQLKSDQWPKAAETFRAVVASKADKETVALARWELGRGSFQAAQAKPQPEAFAAAAARLAEFVEKSPDHPQLPDARFFLGEAFWQAGRRDEALAAWQAFLKAHPQSERLPDVLYALGVGQAETGRKDEAAATLARFAEGFPRHTLADDVALWRADLAGATGKPADADKLLAAVVDRKGPKAADALERLATARWNRKDWPAAAAAFASFAERHPDSPRARRATLSAGIAFSEAGKTAEARTWLAKAAAGGGPEAGEAAHRLVLLELAGKRPDQAAEMAKKALEKLAAANPSPDAETRRLAAKLALARADALWENRDRRADALAAYAAVIKDHPDDPAAKAALSMTALGQLEAGNAAEALAAADRFLARHAAGKADEKSAADDAMVADVRAIRAEALLAKGDAAAAAAAYAELVAKAGGKGASLPRWRLRQGAALAKAGQWRQAHEALAAAAGGLEGDLAAEGLLLDGSALLELKEPKEAVKVLEKLEKAHPAWPRRDEALALLSRANRDAGDKAAAAAVAERLVAEYPASQSADLAWYRLGQARQDAGRYDDAIKAFTKAREAKPKGPRAAASLLATGWCHEAAGRLDEAEWAWTGVVDGHPDSPSARTALLARADARQRRGDFKGGLADARGVLAKPAAGKADEAAADALLVEGLCLIGLKDYPPAIAALRKRVEQHPQAARTDRALFELGAAESLGGRGADAAKSFAELVKRFPTSPHAGDAAFELGEAAWTAGDFAAAAGHYGRAITAAEADPKNPTLAEQARHKLAWTFVSRGDHAAAAKAFAAQLSAHPAGPLAADAEAMRGESLFRAGDAAGAAAAFEKALADPKKLSSADIRGLAAVRAAECAAKLERWEPSLAFADRYLAAEPSGPQAAQARYAAAWARQNLGRLDEALAGYRAIADASRTDLAARARLMEGEVLFEQGQHREAIKAFFKAAYGFGEKEAPAAFHPWQAQATFEAARCFEVLGQKDKARGLYAELVDRYPDCQQTPAARKRLEALGPGK
jgi:TolA-binding protein